MAILWRSEKPVVIHSANLLGSNEKQLPPLLFSQSALYYLALPSQLTKHINGDVPFKHLKGLQISDGNITFHKNTILPDLLYLSVPRNAKFSMENLPNLRSLLCKYQKSMIPKLSRYTVFDELSLRSVNENIFSDLTRINGLYSLGIHWGKIDNIDDISFLQSYTNCH